MRTIYPGRCWQKRQFHYHLGLKKKRQYCQVLFFHAPYYKLNWIGRVIGSGLVWGENSFIWNLCQVSLSTDFTTVLNLIMINLMIVKSNWLVMILGNCLIRLTIIKVTFIVQSKIQFGYFNFGYIWSRKMKWANVTKLQNAKKSSKIKPFFGYFWQITATFLEKNTKFSLDFTLLGWFHSKRQI